MGVALIGAIIIGPDLGPVAMATGIVVAVHPAIGDAYRPGPAAMTNDQQPLTSNHAGPPPHPDERGRPRTHRCRVPTVRLVIPGSR